MQAPFSKVLNIQLDVCNKLFRKMILSLKLNGIWEYVDNSNRLMNNEYIIKISEYDNIQISKQAYNTIYVICKLINGWDSSKAM